MDRSQGVGSGGGLAWVVSPREGPIHTPQHSSQIQLFLGSSFGEPRAPTIRPRCRSLLPPSLPPSPAAALCRSTAALLATLPSSPSPLRSLQPSRLRHLHHRCHRRLCRLPRLPLPSLPLSSVAVPVPSPRLCRSFASPCLLPVHRCSCCCPRRCIAMRWSLRPPLVHRATVATALATCWAIA